MFNGMSKPTLVVAALIGGLTLFVAGFFIAAEMRSAVASPVAATTGGGCYTNWNANTCAAGYTAVETGEWTTVVAYLGGDMYGYPPGGDAFICASPKLEGESHSYAIVSDADSGGSSHKVSHEPCAICCASGGAAVGGIGELPPMAGIGGSPSHNYAVAATLALVAVVAFAAGGWYARQRRLGQ